MSNYEDILDLCPRGWDGAEEMIGEHLDWLGDIDLAEPNWTFDLLRIYRRKSDGVYLWATDSGCSCPSPFEDTPIKEFAEANTVTALRSALEPVFDEADFHAADLRAELRKLLKAAETSQ